MNFLFQEAQRTVSKRACVKCTPLRGSFCAAFFHSFPGLAQPVTKSLHSVPQRESKPRRNRVASPTPASPANTAPNRWGPLHLLTQGLQWRTSPNPESMPLPSQGRRPVSAHCCRVESRRGVECNLGICAPSLSASPAPGAGSALGGQHLAGLVTHSGLTHTC